VFDVSRPGLAIATRATSKTRRSREGQRGIISCIDFSPDYSGLYAAGSFAGSTGLYVENTPGLIALLGGHTGGVTQVRFSHDGLYLFTAARCDGRILLWDARNTCEVLASFERRAGTNQRIGFDLSADSRGLITASQDGRVLAYDCTQPEQAPAVWLTFSEATNAAALHPSLPLLAVSVGERHFPLDGEDGEADGSDAELAEADCYGENGFSIWELPRVPAADSYAQSEVTTERVAEYVLEEAAEHAAEYAANVTAEEETGLPTAKMARGHETVSSRAKETPVLPWHVDAGTTGETADCGGELANGVEGHVEEAASDGASGVTLGSYARAHTDAAGGGRGDDLAVVD